MSRTKGLILLVVAIGAGVYWYSSTRYSIKNNPPPAGPILAFGDSLTVGVGAAQGQSYPDLLAERIGRPVLNRGVPGDTIADAAARLDRDVLTEKPGIVLILLGGNDLLRQMDLDASFFELERIVRRIQDNGALVVLVGLKALAPVGGMGGRYKKLARRTDAVYVPDILDGIFGRQSMMSDQIHPNAQGYARMADRLADALKPYL